MADEKITELVELTTVNQSDLLAIVDDPAGSPITKKITVANATVDKISNSIVAAKGDLITATANDAPAIQSVGTDGQNLRANSATTNGIDWADTMTSMSRQAIINGNFDVWQRGTTKTITTNITDFLTDRWKIAINPDSGTLPSIVVSRQLLTSGDISNSFYYYRIAPDGAGTSLGNGAFDSLSQYIENGTRLLAGDGKKVTLSFYARASVASKKIGISLRQNYGTTGSPTAEEIITGEIITLTSSWVKYTKTFTTNTLAGKTFGTSNDDFLRCIFYSMWGTTIATAQFGGGAAETYGGSGTIDIAQVQLCAGDVALPFMPKSFEEELRACQRYYAKTFPYATAPAQAATLTGSLYTTASGTTVRLIWFYPTPMRIAPTIVLYSPDAASSNWRGAGTPASSTFGESEFNVLIQTSAAGATDQGGYNIHAAASAEL